MEVCRYLNVVVDVFGDLKLVYMCFKAIWWMLFSSGRHKAFVSTIASRTPRCLRVAKGNIYFSAPNRLYSHHRRLIGRFPCPYGVFIELWLAIAYVNQKQRSSIGWIPQTRCERSAVARARTGNKWILWFRVYLILYRSHYWAK